LIGKAIESLLYTATENLQEPEVQYIHNKTNKGINKQRMAVLIKLLYVSKNLVFRNLPRYTKGRNMFFYNPAK